MESYEASLYISSCCPEILFTPLDCKTDNYQLFTFISMKKYFLAFLLFAINVQAAWAQEDHKLSLGEHELFKVGKAKSPITIDGKMDEPSWGKTESRSFDHFYNIDKPSDKQNTNFRMLWDDTHLYMFFECEDEFITAREKNRDGHPYLDDCAEIFLIPVPDSLDIHLGFELNLYKVANDFVFFNGFYEGKDIAYRVFNPDYEVEISVDGTINDNSDTDKGWAMEMAIPLKVFKGIDSFVPVKEGNKWAFLAVRQDRNDAEGNRRSTSTIFPIYDISKNVHQPNRFGLLEFVK